MRRLLAAGLASAALIAGVAAPVAASPPEKQTYSDDIGCDFLYLLSPYENVEYCWQASGSLISKFDGDQTLFKKFRTEHYTFVNEQGIVVRDCTRTERYISVNGVTKVDASDEKCEIMLW